MWELKSGKNLGERLEDESAVAGAGVGELECWGVALFLAEGDQVEIDRAGFVDDFFRLPAEFFFESLKFGEEGFRRFVREGFEGRNGVDKQRRAGRAINGCALPQG